MSKNVINETFKKHLKLLRKHLNENSPQSQKIDNFPYKIITLSTFYLNMCFLANGCAIWR